jgi:hypothetical protein
MGEEVELQKSAESNSYLLHRFILEDCRKERRTDWRALLVMRGRQERHEPVHRVQTGPWASTALQTKKSVTAGKSLKKLTAAI